MCGSRTLLQIKTEKFRTVLCIEQKKIIPLRLSESCPTLRKSGSERSTFLTINKNMNNLRKQDMRAEYSAPECYVLGMHAENVFAVSSQSLQSSMSADSAEEKYYGSF